MTPTASMPVALNGKPPAAPDVYAGKIALRAVHPDDLHLLWIWLNEFPRANFDDYSPKTFEEFQVEIFQRMQPDSSGRVREFIVVALLDGKPIGFIGYRPITERLGTLHGICFSKAVHGKGHAAFAVRNLINAIMKDGKVQKIEANYFKDNARIKKFLRKLGFEHEGTRFDHTLRQGKPIDVSLVALYRRNWKET